MATKSDRYVLIRKELAVLNARVEELKREGDGFAACLLERRAAVLAAEFAELDDAMTKEFAAMCEVF